ncbi:MAG: enolase C-terminal domain-like protein [Verrucomicrobiia bacterium]
MKHPTDIHPTGATLYFLPVRTRVPLKFGPETLTEVTCARVSLRVVDRQGKMAEGWGETPLSVQWVWPSRKPYQARHEALMHFCRELAQAWATFAETGHPIEVGHAFKEQVLPKHLALANANLPAGAEPIPWLAALVCCSAFDIALHDAYGQLLGCDVYATYGPEHMHHDLAHFLTPVKGSEVSFSGKFPSEFLHQPRQEQLRAWHLVGGLDPLDPDDLQGNEPNDGYPVLLSDWIRRDGLTCLKVKLRGNDWDWDYNRLVRVGRMAIEHEVEWLSADFNCTVTDPAWVASLLDRLRDEHPRIYGMILYVEQPFPYDLERLRIDTHSVSARKPLFLDESAHDWRLIALGRELGWSGVALKTCKTQTEAILSACWANAHGMPLMVQDLSNPMLAQIPHLLLAAHTGTIMGVETNGMQFYPEASLPEQAVHPGVFQRRGGKVDLTTIRGPGFGYRLTEIQRQLPPPCASFGAPELGVG